MKRILPLAAVLALAACATSGAMDDNQKLALYRAHAGAPVNSFVYLGRFDSWTELGDRALAIWTRPSEAWLLELDGPCNGLPFAQAIGLSSHTGAVSARFDDVIVRDSVTPSIPCRIETIRPLDVAAIKAAERAARAQSGRAPSESGT